jgi:hypothetical protein
MIEKLLRSANICRSADNFLLTRLTTQRAQITSFGVPMITSAISADFSLESFKSYQSIEPFSHPFSFDGTPVQVENLDVRLKMILKLKLREFIHLSPFFQDIPAIDLSLYQVVPKTRALMVSAQDDCPNRLPGGFAARRRVGRHVAV